VIAEVGFENFMMEQSVALKWVGEPGQLPMHDKTMQQPFEEGARDYPQNESRSEPD
jgi:hypothetical protein